MVCGGRYPRPSLSPEVRPTATCASSGLSAERLSHRACGRVGLFVLHLRTGSARPSCGGCARADAFFITIQEVRRAMLSAERNAFMTRVGPGQPMGELFRRFWVPLTLSEQLAEPG